MQNKKSFLGFLLLTTVLSFGQAKTTEIGLITDNDLYTSSKNDMYYTNGLELFYRFLSKNDNPKINKKITEFRIGQYLYNPRFINEEAVDINDRPFAGYLFAEAGKSFFYQSESVLKTDFQIGFLGPNGAGKSTLMKILTTYINVGTSQTYGANVFASYNPLKKWTLMTNIGVNTYDVNNEYADINTPTYLNYNLFLRSATTFNKGLSVEFFGVVNSPRRTFQGKTDAMVFYGAALKQEILKKKGTIGINTLNPFSRDLHIKTENTTNGSFQSSNIYYPLRSFGVNFSYSFGKLKFTEKKKIKNDDMKQEQQQGGGMGGGMGQGK